MGKIKLGIIGLGGISKGAHIPALINMADVEIVALCDIIPERIDQARKIIGDNKIPGFVDYKELIKSGVDAVDICTPNYLHSIIAVEALKAGLHVFCEKPDAVSVAEAEKMKKAAADSGKTLMVMRNNRHTEASKFAKKYISDGKAGDIYAGRCGWIRRRGIPGKGGWFTTKELSGGGPLIDLGVHMIDLAIYLMGNPTPVAVSGSTYNKFASLDTKVSDSVHSAFGDTKKDGIFDVEDLAIGFIKFDNGACLQIEFSWASNIEKEQTFVELRGSNAGIKWSSGTSCEIYSEENEILTDLSPILSPSDGHGRNLRHFFDVIGSGIKPDFEPVQGVNMIKILQAIYQSAKTGKEVYL